MEHIFFLLALIPGVLAVAPPHPDFAEEYWRKGIRLPKSYSNSSSNDLGCAILHESCDHLSSLSRSAESNVNILKQSNELHSLVLLVQFTDHSRRILPSRDDLDLLWNANDLSEELPTGSIHRYIYLNSYKRFNVKATVMDWLLSDDTELHYSFDESGLNTEIAVAVYPALEALDQEDYDFSVHDSDGDMNIDSLVFLHSGYSAETGEKDCHNDREPEQRIWSHASSHVSRWRSKDGYSFDFYITASSMRGACGSERANIGIITHELIHSWGVPDLYDTGSVGKGTGHYDIMSGPYGWDGMQTHPFYMSPWTRMKSGFLEPIEIEYDGHYPIAASALSNQIYIIKASFPEGEYLLIENRQPLDYDAQMNGSGILIWHIDDRQALQKEPGYAGQEGWPSNGNHYQVALLQADGSYDLEKGGNYGDCFDYFTEGAELDPDSELHPNSNAYQNGEILSTRIRIYDISPSSQLMHFRVSGLGASPTSSPSPSASPTEYPSPSPSANPTEYPSPNPTPPPSEYPSSSPTQSPTEYPSSSPSESPQPSSSPTTTPTEYHHPSSSSSPTDYPSSGTTVSPAGHSSPSPASPPSAHSSLNLTTSPSEYSSQNLSPSPTTFPSEYSSNLPTSPVPTFSGVDGHSTELQNNGPLRRPWKATAPNVLAFGESSLYPSRPSSAPASDVLSHGPSVLPTALRGAVPSIAPSDSPITTLSVSPTIHGSSDLSLLSSTTVSLPHGAIIKPSVTPSPSTSISLPPSLVHRASPSPRTMSTTFPTTTVLLSKFTGTSSSSVGASIEPNGQPASRSPASLSSEQLPPSTFSPTKHPTSILPLSSRQNLTDKIPTSTSTVSLRLPSYSILPTSASPSGSATSSPTEVPSSILKVAGAVNIFDRKRDPQRESRRLANSKRKY